MQTFLDNKTIAKEKLLETLAEEQKILILEVRIIFDN